MKVLNSLKGHQCDHFYSIFKKMPPKKPAQGSKPAKEKGSTPSTEVSPKNDKSSSSEQIQESTTEGPRPSRSWQIRGLNEVSPLAPTSPPASTTEGPRPSRSGQIRGRDEASKGLKKA